MNRRSRPGRTRPPARGNGREMSRQFPRDEGARAYPRRQISFVEQLPIRHYRDVARYAQFEREVARGGHTSARGQSPLENIASQRPVNLIVQHPVRIELQEHAATSRLRPYYGCASSESGSLVLP